MIMKAKLTRRQEAEAIEQFGDDLAKLCRTFCDGFALDTVDRVNAVPDQQKLETIAKAFQTLGDQMCRECDEADEAYEAVVSIARAEKALKGEV